MAYSYDFNEKLVIIQIVNDPIVADSNTIRHIRTYKFSMSIGMRITSKSFDSFGNEDLFFLR